MRGLPRSGYYGSVGASLLRGRGAGSGAPNLAGAPMPVLSCPWGVVR